MANTFDEDEVTRLRVALARIARTVDRQVSGDGLTRTQLSVLGSVSRLKSVGVRELAELEGLNPTMLSRILSRLEADALVERSADPDDGRAVRVRITSGGFALHQHLRAQRTQLFTERLAQLPAADVAVLLAALPALESLSEQLRATGPATAALSSR